MFAPVVSCARWAAVVLATVAATGCAGTGDRLLGVVTPYRVDVVQGNFVSREQVQALRPGMARQQVREILGTPLMTSLFHGDRWEYVFTLKRPQVEPQTRRLTVFFSGEVLDRVEGDEMPSESEFVASLGSRVSSAKVPVLEATPEQLARFPKPAQGAAGAAGAASATSPSAADAGPSRLPSHYPPLE